MPEKKPWRDILIEKFDRWTAISTPKVINRTPVSWWDSEKNKSKKEKKRCQIKNVQDVKRKRM